MNKISLEEKKRLACEFGLELAMLEALLEVESAGRGFFLDWYSQWRIKIQFEPHWFKKYTDTYVVNGVRPQREEWDAFNKAAAINLEAAMLSTSWGLGQVMGFNYRMAGFHSVGEMVDAFKESEFNQVRGMLSFCKSKKPLYQALKENDFDRIAYYYNGSGYKTYSYDERLRKAYNKHK